MTRPKVLLSWSSGKDSAWTLHVLREQRAVEVVGLLTTINQRFERVAMHAVRRELLVAQAQAAGLPLWEVPIPSPCSNEEYETAMKSVVERARADGVTHMAFGDLYLEEVRRYREERLAGTGITPLFPLWQIPTHVLARSMLQGGVRAVLTCVDPKQLAPDFVGQSWDAALLSRLPAACDPCGENGEFHTFVTEGPMLRAPLAVEVGEIVERDGFWFADVVLGDQRATSPIST